MAPVMLEAPGDPADGGLLVVLAVVLVVGLVLAHLRLLRAVGRASRPSAPGTDERSSTDTSERRSA
jgi:hypothetical protein